MIEGSVEGLTRLLEAIAGWGMAAGGNLWESLRSPENVPTFLSSLVKFSLGPTLAFVLARRANKDEQRSQQESERQAVRTLLRIEMDYNLSEFERLREDLLGWDPEKSIGDNFYKIRDDFYKIIGAISLHKTAINGLVSDIPKGLSTSEIEDTYRFYSVVDGFLEVKQKYFLEMTNAPFKPVRTPPPFNYIEIETSVIGMAQEAVDLVGALENTIAKGNPLT